MKKRNFVLLTLIATTFLAFSLTGCGSNPKSVVQSFCTALPKQDFDKMSACFEEDMVTKEDFTDFYYDLSELGLDSFFASADSNIKTRITKQEIDPDDKEYATVTVQLEYPDYSEAFVMALDAYVAEYEPYDITEIDATVFVPLLQTQIAASQATPISEEVLIPCEKIEKNWVISYDYDFLERIGTALSCNMIDAYMDYEYEYPDEEDDFSDEDFEDGDVSDGDIEDDDFEDGNDLYDGDEFLDENADEAELYDFYMDLINSVDPSGASMVISGYTVDYDDDEYYVVTGDIYEYDIYAQWRAIVGTDGKFAAAHPDIYEALDSGLWAEDCEIYIPKDAVVSGVWPANSGASATSDLNALLSSGQSFVYFEDDNGDATTIYKCSSN